MMTKEEIIARAEAILCGDYDNAVGNVFAEWKDMKLDANGDLAFTAERDPSRFEPHMIPVKVKVITSFDTGIYMGESPQKWFKERIQRFMLITTQLFNNTNKLHMGIFPGDESLGVSGAISMRN